MSAFRSALGVSPPQIRRQPSAADVARSSPGVLDDVDRRLLAELTRITQCHRITGEDCFIMQLHATSLQAMEETLDRFLLHGQTTTAITVSSPVPLRSLPVPDPARSATRDSQVSAPEP